MLSVAAAEAASVSALGTLSAHMAARNVHLPGLMRVQAAGIPPLSRHDYDPANIYKTQGEAHAVLEIFLIIYVFRLDAARAGAETAAFDALLMAVAELYAAYTSGRR